MPRRARLIVPGLPHHIVQRGHNRSAVFVEEPDYEKNGTDLFSNWQELKRVYRLFTRVPGKTIDVYWVFKDSDLPNNMKFFEDENPKKKGHFFLTVTEQMPIHQLVSNLKWIADRMAVIKNAEKVL